ncbi:hypothetical protein [Nocardia yunnanensis]|uniref:hypothetical protein n=1 Tax=Nocardia yunnanensis TaxID=2382165 RepID=UPI0013C420DA|nr:hypothetical protein [Nocardia yunnanensis]
MVLDHTIAGLVSMRLHEFPMQVAGSLESLLNGHDGLPFAFRDAEFRVAYR